MALEGSIARQMGDIVVDKRQYITDDDLVMGVNDNFVEFTLTASNTGTCTLPSVVEAVGRIYTIHAIDAGGGCTVQDKADDAGLTDITLDADGESTVLYSDGVYWNELQANYS